MTDNCARCGHFIKPGERAQSRVEPKPLCSECGVDEAVYAWAYHDLPPLGHKIVWPNQRGAATRAGIQDAIDRVG